MRRINGLASVEDVPKTIFDTSYMILGLGDVYLGAPCAVPVDPRHRLLTSKYNPARTYTAEGTVGIGGVYMCIYGMDSPGGYQSWAALGKSSLNFGLCQAITPPKLKLPSTKDVHAAAHFLLRQAMFR
jgi:allophanate hydrolase subunit 1